MSYIMSGLLSNGQ